MWVDPYNPLPCNITLLCSFYIMRIKLKEQQWYLLLQPVWGRPILLSYSRISSQRRTGQPLRHGSHTFLGLPGNEDFQGWAEAYVEYDHWNLGVVIGQTARDYGVDRWLKYMETECDIQALFQIPVHIPGASVRPIQIRRYFRGVVVVYRCCLKWQKSVYLPK